MHDELTIQRAMGGLVPPGLIDGWRRRGVGALLPLQRRVAREWRGGRGLAEGGNLMVLAPTS